MKKLGIVFVFLITTGNFSNGPTLSSALAGETEDPIPNSERVVVRKGEKASFDGILVTREYLATLVAAVEAEKKRGEVLVAAARADAIIEAERVAAVRAAEERASAREVASCDAQRDRDRKTLEKALTASKGSEAWLPLAGGFLAGALACGAGAFAVR